MGGFVHKLLGKLNIDGRGLAIFVLSLLLAFGIWVLFNLSENYSSLVSVSVTAQSNLEGYASESSNSSVIVARCRTSGFKLLRFSDNSKRVKTVFFDPVDLHRVPGESELFRIDAADLVGYVNELFGGEAILESFVSQSVQFRFTRENHKKVPVQAVENISYKSQYMAMGRIKLVPDSVTVYGEAFQLQNINRIMTETISHENVKSSVHGVARLESVPGVRLSDRIVNYSIDVTRYVEVSEEVFVSVRNIPAGHDLSVFPPVAKVVYKCAFPLSINPSGKMRVYIDYKDFAESRSGRCIVHASGLPSGVIDASVEPEVFDCIENIRK